MSVLKPTQRANQDCNGRGARLAPSSPYSLPMKTITGKTPCPAIGSPVVCDNTHVVYSADGPTYIKFFNSLVFNAGMRLQDGSYVPYWLSEEWLNASDNTSCYYDEGSDEYDRALDQLESDIMEGSDIRTFRVAPPKGYRFVVVMSVLNCVDGIPMYLFGLEDSTGKVFNVPVPNRTWSSGALCSGRAIGASTRSASIAGDIHTVSNTINDWAGAEWNSDLSDTVPVELAQAFLRWGKDGSYRPDDDIYRRLVESHRIELNYHMCDRNALFIADAIAYSAGADNCGSIIALEEILTSFSNQYNLAIIDSLNHPATHINYRVRVGPDGRRRT